MVNHKPSPKSDVPQPGAEEQRKIDTYFREAHQKIRSEAEDIEHRIKVTRPEFSSYKHTLFLAPSRDYWYFLAVRIEIPPCYAMIGEFAVTYNRTVETEVEPRLISECNHTETEGALGLPRNELESLAWAPPRSLLNPSPDVILHAKVQALAWYCRLLALRELLQRLDLGVKGVPSRAIGERQERQQIAAEGQKAKGLEGLPSKNQDLSRYFDSADLTDRQRECISLRLEHGLKPTKIGQRLGIHHSTVQEHIARAKIRLQQALARERRDRQ